MKRGKERLMGGEHTQLSTDFDLNDFKLWFLREFLRDKERQLKRETKRDS